MNRITEDEGSDTTEEDNSSEADNIIFKNILLNELL